MKLRLDATFVNATIYHSVEDEFTFVINQTIRTVAKTERTAA